MGSCSCHKLSPKNSQSPPNISYNPININIHNNTDKNIYINDNNNINNLNKQYNDMKFKNRIFYDDIEEQESYIENYKLFISELNYQIDDLKDHLHISLYKEKFYENLLNKEENNELLKEIEIISNKIKEFNYLLEKQKHLLKNLENNFQIIQEQFNEINNNKKFDKEIQDFMLSMNIDSIKYQINQSENIIKQLLYNKKLYENKKSEIENDIKTIQFITEQKVTSIKNKRKKNLRNKYLNKYNNNYEQMNDSLFLKGSMLFGIKDFGKADNIFKSMYIFKQDETEDYDTQNLLKKNYHVTCYLNDEYDIYDINYELKAVGLPDDMMFNSSSFGFAMDTHIEIILFEIDGKRADYEYEKYSLRFDIKLKNLESNKIHIKYKESPLYEKMTNDEKEIRTIYKISYYGLSKRLVGQNAKFILINESNYEIINFKDEFFIKRGDNEYQWGGKVPENGKETIIRMSKKESRVNFYEKHEMNTLDNSYIKNTVIKIPFCYSGGNNQLIKLNYGSKQAQKILLDKKKKVYEVKYININSKKGEFIIEGELINRCKGEWIINLTNEEIESLIPPDFKSNKEFFKKISNDIIKQYDEEHKDDLIVVPSVTKIGKWIKQNIKYDLTYVGLNNITATETYKTKKGVCHHITKLFNALMYSLGYQVLYILGFAIDKKKNFSIEDSHAWSLVKIEGKWLPFDATWGIFSGKLPVTHIFKQIDCKTPEIIAYDRVKIEQILVKGNIN